LPAELGPSLQQLSNENPARLGRMFEKVHYLRHPERVRRSRSAVFAISAYADAGRVRRVWLTACPDLEDLC